MTEWLWWRCCHLLDNLLQRLRYLAQVPEEQDELSAWLGALSRPSSTTQLPGVDERAVLDTTG